MLSYVGLAAMGRNQWWRYVISLAFILFMWMIVGSIPLIAIVFINGGMPFPWAGEPAVPGPLSGFDPFITFYLPVAFSFVALLSAVAISVKFIHCRPLQSLISGEKRIDFRRIGTGFLVFLGFNAIAMAVSFMTEPSSVVVSFEPGRLLLFAPIYLILTAIQTTGEELFFRGYLMQGIGNAIRRPHLAAIISSFLFMLVHLNNPEVSTSLALLAAYYFASGLWLCLITLKDGSLELALGAHAANNMFIIIMNYETSALELVPSIIKQVGTGVDDIALSLALFIVMAAGAYVLLFHSPLSRKK